MVLEYTADEYNKLQEIDIEYAAKLDIKDAELRKNARKKDVYARLLAERDALIVARMDEFAAVRAAAEKARFDALGGDLAAIVAEARRQVPLIIEEKAKQRAEYDLVSPDLGQLVDLLQAGEITVEEFETRSKSAEFEPRSQEPFISSVDARRLILDGIQLFTDFLKAHPKEHRALYRYVSEYISTSPYVAVEIAEPQETRPPLPAINRLGLMNDKVTNVLISKGPTYEPGPGGQLALTFLTNQAPKGKRPVIVNTTLTFNGEGRQLSRSMDSFDRAVYDAVSTAFYYNQIAGRRSLTISPQEIWRMMNGADAGDGQKKPSPAQVQRVCDSLEKMMYTRLHMDVTAEMKAFKLSFDDSRVSKGVIDTPLLMAKKISFTTEKGQTVTGYQIVDEPALYSYNKAKKHLVFVDCKYLDTTATTGNEGHTVEIRGYLLLQVQLMINGQRNSNRIMFETLYQATGLKAPAERVDRNAYNSEAAYYSNIRKEAAKDREKVGAILDAWMQHDFIKGYSFVKAGKAIAGVDIELNANTKKGPAQSK